MGSMLAEALPFLRSIATSIRKALGNGHPGTLPTNMVAYASAQVTARSCVQFGNLDESVFAANMQPASVVVVSTISVRGIISIVSIMRELPTKNTQYD
jgi:hypothetical protein